MKIAKRLTILVIILIISIFACSPAQTSHQLVSINPTELQAFADPFFIEQMEKLKIPGLVFILVQDGEVIYSKGYGFADLEQQISIDPDLTLVRIGSVSKTIVATAVMQLVEQDVLDLHTDVNEYLTKFQIENPFPDPVTLANLLTHTAGFEDPPYESNTDPENVQPLSEYLATSMPPVTHPPGSAHIYSNHGYALAALIVEEVSGLSFDRYVAENIFIPLGMDQTSYLLSPPLPNNIARGYAYQEGQQIPQPMDYDSDYPGGSIVSTASDMSKFILANLQNGCVEDECILDASTILEMHQRKVLTPYEGQSATYGFVEGIIDDVRLIGHSGAIRGFGNILDMIPEHNIGYFFSFNEECYQTEACQIIPEFREQFLERFIR